MSMNRSRLIQGLEKIMKHPSTADPWKMDMKELQVYTCQTLIEVIKTLEKIDKNQAALSKKLAEKNDRFQVWMIILTTVILLLTGATYWKLLHP